MVTTRSAAAGIIHTPRPPDRRVVVGFSSATATAATATISASAAAAPSFIRKIVRFLFPPAAGARTDPLRRAHPQAALRRRRRTRGARIDPPRRCRLAVHLLRPRAPSLYTVLS